MNKVTPRKPKGFGEYLPADQLEFNRLLSIVKNTYERYGYVPLDTPDVELADVLLAKGGGETEQEVFRFRRTDKSDELCLRYDLTVPLARYVAEHYGALTFPFRRYHIGKVHRAERPQAGRFREFYQCDIDVIGSTSLATEAELPLVINEIFTSFGFGKFTIRVNNRKVLNGFFDSLGYSNNIGSILRIIDKLEKKTPAEIETMLKDVGVTADHTKEILKFVSIDGTTEEVMHQLQELTVDSEIFNEGVSELRQLVDYMKGFGIPESSFRVDLKIARGLDYYTGTVYETVLNDYPELGSVCSGGRYDDLANYYTDQNLPGVGISIGLSRLFYKLREIGVIDSHVQSPARIVLFPMEETQHIAAATLAQNLRRDGHSVVLYTESDKMKKKMRFAQKMGFDYALVLGEDELLADSITMTDMRNDEWQQATITVQDLLSRL